MPSAFEAIVIPPPELWGHVPALRDQIAALERLRTEAAIAAAAAVEAEGAAVDAERADRQALADRARGKRKAKAQPTAPTARDTLDQAKINAEALQQAADDAHAELAAAIDAHREEYRKALDVEVARLRDQVRAALAALRQRETERMAIRALLDWLVTPRRFTPAKFRDQIGIRQPNGEPYRLDLLLAMLESTLAPDEEGAAAEEIGA